MNGNPLPPKKEVALALLERGSVHVHLDPRAVGVVVPAWFKRQPQLVLQVGLNMPVPIPDLRVDEDGMSCTLSFNRSPFFCIVPWSSVYAMVGDDGRGMVWPEDVPPEVAMQARSREGEPDSKGPSSKKPSPLGHGGPGAHDRSGPSRTSGRSGSKATLAVVKSPDALPRKSAAKAMAKPRAIRSDQAPSASPKKPRPKRAAGEAAREKMAKKAGAGDTASGGARERVLVSIPSAAVKPAPPAEAPPNALPARAAAPKHAPSEAEAPTPRPSPETRPTPAGRTSPPAGKAKREIPPYLRVVK